MVAEYAALEAKIAAEEERRLDARWGEADPDYDDGEAINERLDALSDAIARTLHDQSGISPLAAADNSQSGRDHELEKHGGDTASEKLDALAQDFAKQIESDGQIHMRDGLSWWAR
jgi:hypothetical protein